MKQTLELPSDLPSLPNPPCGWHWEYRGLGWSPGNGDKSVLACYWGKELTGWRGSNQDNDNWSMISIAGFDDWHYCELVKDEDLSSPVDFLPLVVRSWTEWTDALMENMQKAIAEKRVDIWRLLESPALDSENLKFFTDYWCFEDLFETNVAVEHPNVDNTFWYVSTSGDAILVYDPKTVQK